ncbi:citrate lyase subunit beta-like protein [Tieghemostelium lacteum]|uniref:Citrate lyase subunit beta-like protein n=1 Tax=Tieghemostelium lacteum TaxID=361077 RepID=A0A151ZB51_TIELA|nr:citrate lyase subunit beta-like protein [Tieghemostelium lacteum]|eukprot:KYQ91177.1 citrate lyase subunit beta-like protein [Tieghemostelium lacteum]
MFTKSCKFLFANISKPNIKSLSSNIYDKPLRRVLFNVPGSDQRKIDKAVTLKDHIDCIVLDIEDGVAINRKQEARDLIKKSVVEQSFGTSELLVRVNSVDSGLLEEDIEMLSQCYTYIDGIVIPKVDHPDHLKYISTLLQNKAPGNKLKFLASIESARAVVSLKDIICYSETTSAVIPYQLEALIFASEDYCADTGITRTPTANELLYARSAIVNHSIAYGLQAIDMVCINYKDQEALKKETREGIQMGFHGKQAIHPNQIDIIRDSFRPSKEKFEFASKIIEQNDIHQALGKGAFEVDGKMIDMPMVKWAKNILSIESFYPPRQEDQ